MKRLLGLSLLVAVGVFVWQVSSRLSSDALGMAVGLAFGIMAGIPAAALVMVAARHNDDMDDDYDSRRQQPERQLPDYSFQPPVIVIASGQQPVQHRARATVAASVGAAPERRWIEIKSEQP